MAEPQFARTERLHVDVGARKPVTDRAVRLLRRSGEPLNVPATVAQRDVDGRTVLSCDLGLSFLAPADYVLELVAQSGAEAERKLVAFRVR